MAVVVSSRSSSSSGGGSSSSSTITAAAAAAAGGVVVVVVVVVVVRSRKNCTDRSSNGHWRSSLGFWLPVVAQAASSSSQVRALRHVAASAPPGGPGASQPRNASRRRLIAGEEFSNDQNRLHDKAIFK